MAGRGGGRDGHQQFQQSYQQFANSSFSSNAPGLAAPPLGLAPRAPSSIQQPYAGGNLALGNQFQQAQQQQYQAQLQLQSQQAVPPAAPPVIRSTLEVVQAALASAPPVPPQLAARLESLNHVRRVADFLDPGVTMEGEAVGLISDLLAHQVVEMQQWVNDVARQRAAKTASALSSAMSAQPLLPAGTAVPPVPIAEVRDYALWFSETLPVVSGPPGSALETYRPSLPLVTAATGPLPSSSPASSPLAAAAVRALTMAGSSSSGTGGASGAGVGGAGRRGGRRGGLVVGGRAAQASASSQDSSAAVGQAPARQQPQEQEQSGVPKKRGRPKKAQEAGGGDGPPMSIGSAVGAALAQTQQQQQPAAGPVFSRAGDGGGAPVVKLLLSTKR